MSINFSQISAGGLTPGRFAEFDSSQAVQGNLAQPKRFLILCQRLSSGSVQENVPVRITNGKLNGVDYFGRGSLGAAMCAAIPESAREHEWWAIAMDDEAGGVVAAGTITVTGTATKAGTIALLVADTPVNVGVAVGDTANAIATNIAAAVNAVLDCMMTAAATTNVVTASCRHKGVWGNELRIVLGYFGEQLPSGVTVVIVQPTGGTTNPPLAQAIAVFGEQQYNYVANPYTDASNLTALETELTARWTAQQQIEGVHFAASCTALGALLTLGGGRNSPFASITGAGLSPTPAYIWAVVMAAVFGSEPDPGRPRQTLALPGVRAPALPDRFDRTEREQALKAGIATYTVANDGTVLIERVVTTYKTNALGIDDPALRDMETLELYVYARFSWNTRLALKYPRHKLADDDVEVPPGQPIVTPKVIRTEALCWFDDLMGAGLGEDRVQFKRDLKVMRNTQDLSRMDILLPPNFINQMRRFATLIQPRL